jgi:hypothetical protein
MTEFASALGIRVRMARAAERLGLACEILG